MSFLAAQEVQCWIDLLSIEVVVCLVPQDVTRLVNVYASCNDRVSVPGDVLNLWKCYRARFELFTRWHFNGNPSQAAEALVVPILYLVAPM